MPFALNPLDPMNKSMYLEENLLRDIDSKYEYYTSYTPNDLSPQLRPQPTKDSWYYSNDGQNDGHISGFEKVKAFLKGGTYNMVKGLFCNENGFSLGRTALSALGIAAVACTGPLGWATAAGIGALAGVVNFIGSASRAKNAQTDDQARKAYEGFGESIATLGLSAWGGFKGYKGIQSIRKSGGNLLQFKLPKLFKKSTSTPPSTPPSGSGSSGGVRAWFSNKWTQICNFFSKKPQTPPPNTPPNP